MAETVLLALVDWSIRATVLASIVGVLLWAIRIEDAQVKLTAWTVVLVAALLMPVAAPLLPNILIPVPRFMTNRGNLLPQAQPAFNLPIPARDFAAVPRETPRLHWKEAAAGLWMLITLVMLFRLILGLRLSARLVRGSPLTEDGIRESNLVRVPITVGIVRPIVILPTDWREWPERKLRAVLAHEQAHVLRRDPLRQLAASIYRSVAWFHPLAWWLRVELVELAEEAGDDAAIAAGEDRVKYAEALLSFIERTPRRVQWEGVTMANRQTRMRRIDRVLDQNRKLSRPSNNRVLAALVLAALPLIYVTTATQPVWAQTPASPVPALQTAYSKATLCGGNPTFAKWVNEDVAYILAPEERQALEHLGSEAECAMFVDQFWLRRDPTPGTQENEFKAEHYRRIAYANDHFASDDNFGWTTSRGRVYIIYGPPDEIEFHPAGGGPGQPADPFDHWLYHHVDAFSRDILFEFVDSARDKEYRLVFVGGPADTRQVRGPVVFGPIAGLYVEVNHDRTLLITTPVWGGTVPVKGRITDGNGALIEEFEEISRASMYAKEISKSLPAGQYTLHIQAGADNRSIHFEVK